MNKRNIKNILKITFPYSIPVLSGFLVLGIAYGILMKTSGFSIIWSILMSSVAFCGSMQFVAISLFLAGFQPLQAFLLSLMVNARHIFYGLSMLDKYKGMGKLKFFFIYVLCDETFSIVSSIEPPKDITKKEFYFTISLLNYSYWIIATCIGSMLGDFITFDTRGLDFVLTALFVVLFLEQTNQPEKHIAGWIGIVCSIIALLFFQANNMVIPAMIFIMISLLIGRKYLCR